VSSGSAPSSKGEILRSNVEALDGVAPTPARSRGGAGVGFPVAIALGILLAFVLGIGVALLWTSSQRATGAATTATLAQPTATVVPPVAASSSTRRSSSTAGVPLPAVNGISCDALESTVFHIHVHLAIFIDGQEQLIPFGVGVGQPWQITDSAEGPFVSDGSCFYWIHTHTEDGVVHIESPLRRRFTLGDFFAIWQEPLSETQVGPAQGLVIVYINGTRSPPGDPSDIPLTSHERIQLDVGQDVPPYAFAFPPGD
jgi:hypothetical protein